MKYKAGDKFIIEIETHYNHSGEKNSARPLNDNDGANVSELYRIRGFKSLVFDEEGLKKLEPLEDMTAEEYLNIKRWYCEKQFAKGGRVKDLPDWCLEDFRCPENSIEQIEHLRGEYKKAKYEADRMMDIRYDLEDVIAEYGIEDIRKALEQTKRSEDADTPQTDCETCRHYKPACELFSEVCKYEPTTQAETQNSNLTFEKRTMRDCYNCKRYETEGECIECHYEPKDEPQTERSNDE